MDLELGGGFISKGLREGNMLQQKIILQKGKFFLEKQGEVGLRVRFLFV